MYLSRYIKLTPLMIGILWFVRNINAYPTGQYFRVGHFFSHACWDNSKVLMNLFYVQNSLSSLGEMCYPPTHSLATDMQQYLVAPFILTFLWKLRHNKMTLTLFSLATLLTLALYKGYTVYMNNLTTVSYFGVCISQCVNVGTDDSNGKDKSITGNYCIATLSCKSLFACAQV
ncbi:uncharacterized protein LOC113472012, partial [Diaphorina citri]|uniref:Uncharacterized protein LOC113472012 n=1 Tax=Diaphorina citri TaxID=121845 RepID=A0A3Q0JJN0_DIACI